MNAIDPTKTYRTTETTSRSVRILATDIPGPWPVAVLVDGDALVTQLTALGVKSASMTMAPFIIEEKPRIKQDVWINVYDHVKEYYVYHSKETADGMASKQRISCIKVTLDYEVGEGL